MGFVLLGSGKNGFSIVKLLKGGFHHGFKLFPLTRSWLGGASRACFCFGSGYCLAVEAELEFDVLDRLPTFPGSLLLLTIHPFIPQEDVPLIQATDVPVLVNELVLHSTEDVTILTEGVTEHMVWIHAAEGL